MYNVYNPYKKKQVEIHNGLLEIYTFYVGTTKVWTIEGCSFQLVKDQ